MLTYNLPTEVNVFDIDDTIKLSYLKICFKKFKDWSLCFLIANNHYFLNILNMH